MVEDFTTRGSALQDWEFYRSTQHIRGLLRAGFRLWPKDQEKAQNLPYFFKQGWRNKAEPSLEALSERGFGPEASNPRQNSAALSDEALVQGGPV